MAFQDIEQWLRSNGDFARGVELLKLHGNPSSTDLFVFGLPESPMSRERLTKALRALDKKVTDRVRNAPLPQIKERQRDAEDLAERVLHRSLRKPPENLPEEVLTAELRPLRRELDRKWREKIMLKGSLPTLPNGIELRHTASRIVQLGKEIRSGWEVIERWRMHSVVLRTDKPDPVPVHKLVGRRDSLRVQISRMRNGKQKSTPESLAAKEAELADIMNLMKNGAPAAQ
jgi:hypothetical protein